MTRSGHSRPGPKGRGVRLSDLDRGLVYRLGYVGRRWEVLGPESATEGAAPDTHADGERPPAAAHGRAVPARHALPEDDLEAPTDEASPR